MFWCCFRRRSCRCCYCYRHSTCSDVSCAFFPGILRYIAQSTTIYFVLFLSRFHKHLRYIFLFINIITIIVAHTTSSLTQYTEIYFTKSGGIAIAYITHKHCVAGTRERERERERIHKFLNTRRRRKTQS